MKSSYKVIAHYYDKLSGNDCDYDRWFAYIKELAKRHGVREAVDLACGTGKITAKLAAAGYKTVGVDNSEEMLVEARQKCCTLFVKGDMTTFVLPHKTDMAVCVNDGVNYVKQADLQKFFLRVWDNLKVGAPFVFDISSDYKLRRVIGDNVFYVDEDMYTLLWTNDVDKDTLRMNLILFTLGDDDKYTRDDETHVQYIHRCEDVEQALADSGFDVAEVTADYGLPLTDTAQRITFYCVKR